MALNSHVDTLFAQALEASRRCDNNARTPPFFLRAIILQHVWNAFLCLPNGQSPRVHRFRRLRDGIVDTLLRNPNNFARHNLRTLEWGQKKYEVPLYRRVANIA